MVLTNIYVALKRAYGNVESVARNIILTPSKPNFPLETKNLKDKDNIGNQFYNSKFIKAVMCHVILFNLVICKSSL